MLVVAVGLRKQEWGRVCVHVVMRIGDATCCTRLTATDLAECQIAAPPTNLKLHSACVSDESHLSIPVQRF